MPQNHIFIDTNIFQHYLQHPNKDDVISLHNNNLEFYKANKMYFLPQVIWEIKEHWLDSGTWLWEIIPTIHLDDVIHYSIQITRDLFEYLITVWNTYQKVISCQNLDTEHPKYEQLLEKCNDCKKILSDGIVYLTSYKGNAWVLEMLSWVDIKWLIDYVESLWIDRNNEKTTDNVWLALWRIVETTTFGEKMYYWLTYKDINRIIGNFMFDYKFYKQKWEKQQKKVGKDSLIFFQLVFWINNLQIDIKTDKIIFMSSDYWFIKELKRFSEDVASWKLANDENYSDLSTTLIQSLRNIATNLQIIKLNLEEMCFENKDGNKNRLLTEII